MRRCLYTINVQIVINPAILLVHGRGGWILIRRKKVIANSNNRTMSCLKGRLLVLVHQKQENVRTVCWNGG